MPAPVQFIKPGFTFDGKTHYISALFGAFGITYEICRSFAFKSRRYKLRDLIVQFKFPLC